MIRRALRLTATGQLGSLRPVNLRGRTRLDPRSEAIFKRAIEERRRVHQDETLGTAERDAQQKFLKTFANATSYGIHAELNRQPATKRQQALIFAGTEFTSEVIGPEEPGRFFFMPIATLVTGAARLVLAMLEHGVTHAGGDWVFCDTDSMAIVTDYQPHHPGQPVARSVDALPLDTVDTIVQRFEALSPYAFPGSLLKIEDENYDPATRQRRPLYAYAAISAKRYALFTSDSGQLEFVRCTEHGLGTYQRLR